jgi:hypothetical protein
VAVPAASAIECHDGAAGDGAGARACGLWDLHSSAAAAAAAVASSLRIRTAAQPRPQEKYRTCQTMCFCGVFPEIRRAWASVDNSLFLWRYDKRCARLGFGSSCTLRI